MVNIVLSFDDGRYDNYEAYKNILNPLNIPATFNITAGYVLNDIEKNDMPGPHKPMSIEEVAEMNESSICEIAGHGYTHDNTIKSLIKGVEWQRENLGYDFVGIASPHSEYDLKKLEEDIKVFRDNNVVYLRVSNDYSKLKFIKKAIRKINRNIHSGYLYYFINKDSICYNKNFILYSVPVLKNNKLHEVEKFIDIVSRTKKEATVIFMFHSILKEGSMYYEDLFSWDYKDFYDLCVFLNEMRKDKKINIIKTIDIFNQNNKKI